ncbi:MAG: RluA family pseudouridine synthase [Victivallaceae bacterium]
MKFCWKTEEEEERLSAFLKKKLKNEYSNRDISQSILNQRCIVNGFTERFNSYKLKFGDLVEFYPSRYIRPQFESERIIQNYPEYLIYDKPAHITTEELIRLSGLKCVHRLDRDTSGCLIMPKTKKALLKFNRIFSERKIIKTYRAVVYGTIAKKSGCICTNTAPVLRRQGKVIFDNLKTPDSKLTITHWKVLGYGKETTLVECRPETGRTHQIRLHMKTLGHPIVGDPDYGPKKQTMLTFRHLLHALELNFTCPFTQAIVLCRSFDKLLNLSLSFTR